jgi:hypothetical protein
MEQENKVPDSPFLNGAPGNAARRPINACTRFVGLLAGYPSHGAGAHGESILGRSEPADTVKPAAIAHGRKRTG